MFRLTNKLHLFIVLLSTLTAIKWPAIAAFVSETLVLGAQN